jgi:CRP-like cAMP-binding protein
MTSLQRARHGPRGQSFVAALFAAGIRSQFDSLFRCVGLAQGEVLAEPLQRMRRVYFPFSGLISFLVPLADGSLIQTGVVGSDGAVGALQSLDGRVSPNKIVVQMPSTAAVFEADQFAKIAQSTPSVRSLVLSHEQFFLAEVQHRGLQCRSYGSAENVPMAAAHERPDEWKEHRRNPSLICSGYSGAVSH